ncbi:hypothetical protein [Anaeromyxobacter diazotrophicus]|uniref:PKD domain-containing protein n=1 Tax=Anaeromyxobacter diazotrophicus TaxID=2590199 RepID=A0A7I9VN52_9BACT|nr:hypothetical protein [Anaeromyxobacter diazotrophicus]GEJ57559.1 hypothetical protein AMYX_23000 [Anaeromyxobacter diazotrophicus]
MNRLERGIGLAAWLALAAACGTSARQPRSCQQDSECPSSSYCLGGACVAGLLPQAHIAIVGTGRELVSHRLVQFDGSGSVDPNPQHRLTAYRWAVKRASATACDPSPASGAADKLATTFRCAGEYQVELTVKNSLELESAPIAQAVTVAPSANPPVIDGQSPDLLLQHRCAGTPLACQAVDAGGAAAFQLSVTAHDVEDGQALGYQWEVDPPEGADRAAASFEPDARAANPIVRIASAGARIAGVWTFRAHVTDGDALTTPVEIRVTVEDAAPALAAELDLAAFDHTFADNVYRVHGLVKYTASDPEGDPLQVTARVLESAATGCQATLTPLVRSDAVEVTVDLTCLSAQELSPTVAGQALGAGVQRQLEVTVGDQQGGQATVTLPFEVRDTPPTLASLVIATDHGTGNCLTPSGRCFTAAGAIPAPFDPDGDPAELVGYQAQNVDAHGVWSSDGLGRFTLQTDLAYPGSFRAADGRSPVGVLARVKDPWRAADVPLALSIPNRAPVATPFAIGAVASHDGARYLVQGAPATFVDPDGDPLASPDAGNAACSAALAPSASGATLTATCGTASPWSAGPALSSFVASPFVLTVSAADPWERGGSPGARLAAQAPPSPSLDSVTVALPAKCTRVCPIGEPCEYVATVNCTSLTYAPSVRSPVPVGVTVQASSGGSASFSCLGAACSGGLTFSCTAATLSVTLWDGLNPAVTQRVDLVAQCP